MAKNYVNASIGEMAPGMDIQGFYLLSEANVKTSSKGGNYLAGKLSDKDNSIDFKMWDYQSDIHEHVGAVIKIRGQVSAYNGASQLVVERIRLAEPGDPYSLADLVPSAPINADSEFALVQSTLEGLKDPVYKAIALAAMDRMKDDFKKIPAAKTMHHAFLNGLLMHTSNMMKQAAAISDIYGDLINRDLLIVGTLCHDMGKRKEFAFSQIGLVTDYTIPGQLIGHLVMGAQEIAEIAKELGIDPNSEKVLLLQHMLLSHHGQPEWGAAVEPKLMEAEILSHIDVIDARIEVYREMLLTTPVGEMSDFSKAVGNNIYNPKGE